MLSKFQEFLFSVVSKNNDSIEITQSLNDAKDLKFDEEYLKRFVEQKEFLEIKEQFKELNEKVK